MNDFSHALPSPAPGRFCKRWGTPALAAFLLFAGAQAGYAGADYTELLTVPAAQFEPFKAGNHEVDVTVGFYYSPVFGSKGSRPVFNFVQTDSKFGWMLSTPRGSGFLRGNWEVLVDAFGAGVTKGAGDWLVGGRVLFRYNFVQPECRWVPFFEVGGGGLANNVYKDRSQRLIGSGFEFTLVANAGVRYFVSKHWAVVGDIGYQHISNACTASRNVGVNAVGANLGVGYFF